MIRNYKNFRRYKEISGVLIKYGFVFLTDKMKSEGFSNKKSVVEDKGVKYMSTGERIRRACEELGPTFIKLGQILSTRSDIVDASIVEELQKLQDDVISFSFDEAKEILSNELYIDIEEEFLSFNTQSVATGSIGQAYEATLKSGENVIIKVQRPNIEETIYADLEILKDISKIVDEYYKDSFVKFQDVVEEFAINIKRELDFKFEGRNYEKFKTLFKEDKSVCIPKIYWKYTTKRVITLQRIDGIKINDVESINNNGWNSKKIADICAESFMKQVFFYGVFHADPHPGNVFIINEEKIAYIDFGMIGILDNITLEFLTEIFLAAARKDVDKIIDLMIEFDYIDKKTNIKKLREELNFLIYYYYNMPIKNLEISQIFNDFIKFSKENKLKLPSSLTTLIRGIVTFEGTVKILNPNLNIPTLLKKFVKQYYMNKFHVKNIMMDGRSYLEDVSSDIKNIPRHVRSILRSLDKNEIKFTIERINFPNLEKEISNMTYMISISMILSSVIIGSSLVINSSGGYTISGYSMLGIAGFLIATVLGLTLVIKTLLAKKK